MVVFDFLFGIYCTGLKFMQAPMHTCWNALKSAIRSTTFLSAFVGIYQVLKVWERHDAMSSLAGFPMYTFCPMLLIVK